MKQKNNYLYLKKKKKLYSIQNFRGGSGAGSLSVRTHPAISQNAEKCPYILYLIAHFQKYFQGEAPQTPRCREVRGRKSSWKIGGWGRKSSYWELYTPLLVNLT